MRRPMRWYWAALLSIGAYAAGAIGSVSLILGYQNWPKGPLVDVISDHVWMPLHHCVGDPVASYVILMALGMPAAVAGVATYGLLRRGAVQRDGYLHCLKCGYILKGISEPRCPECGERI